MVSIDYISGHSSWRRRTKSTLDPIHPIALKSRSGIASWGGWPQDVEPLLRKWNSGWPGHTLSFYWERVFKCAGCNLFCEGGSTAYHNREWVCDDCLIARARATLADLPA